MSRRLTIEIPGTPVSGNHSHYRSLHKTKEYKEFIERVRGRVFAAALEAGWKRPKAINVDLYICNIRMDRENVAKTLHDALKACSTHIPDDYWILDGRIAKYKDDKGPRVVVIIEPLDASEYGFKP